MRLLSDTLLVFGLVLASGAQQTHYQTHSPRPNDSDLSWNFTTPPEDNTTSHFIFETVNSFLQHWPSTRYRNGHSIVPGTIPVGTLLYHGRTDDKLPNTPEWTASDPEHSLLFAGDSNATTGTLAGRYLLTFATTRPLNILYFDGSSAVKLRDSKNYGGTTDTQDLLVWGRVDPSRWVDEDQRIHDLCEWGREFGLDAYVRMEMDFEAIICDFSQGLELISTDYLASWWTHESIPQPHSHSDAQVAFQSQPRLTTPEFDPFDPSFPVFDMIKFETIHAGTWHDHFPGDTRFILDLTRFVSFYDTSLAPSLISQREGLERWDHRAAGVSDTDLKAVLDRLRSNLERRSPSSGIDWQTLYRTVLQRYAQRLELVNYLLDSSTRRYTDNELAIRIQTQLRIILVPYTLHTARPTEPYIDNDASWALPIWKSCATTHTAYIHRNSNLQSRLTPSERLLLGALDDTSREICRVIVRMWVEGVHAGIDPLLPHPRGDVSRQRAGNLEALLTSWRKEHSALMTWLDWSVWVKCRPACGDEEMCYLPTWPFFLDGNRSSEPDRDDRWKRPQPRCIRKFAPYSEL
ncbi:hypothetical protein R3P38DRAFT_3091410 [Favolaschia claudopus]|uniref:Uncharacterized protein n=1 Tax=Favolaschia claudopus TaxID=2862362 RepID=A0AAV9ZSY1_9AGAR